MGTREEMTFLVVLYVLDSTLMAVAKTIRARRKPFVDREPLVFFQDIDEIEDKPPTPPTPVKGPEEEDKVDRSEQEAVLEDKHLDAEAAKAHFSIFVSVSIACSLVGHWLSRGSWYSPARVYMGVAKEETIHGEEAGSSLARQTGLRNWKGKSSTCNVAECCWALFALFFTCPCSGQDEGRDMVSCVKASCIFFLPDVVIYIYGYIMCCLAQWWREPTAYS